MQTSTAVKIQPEKNDNARIVGLVPLEQLRDAAPSPRPESSAPAASPSDNKDDFLMQDALTPWSSEMLARQEKRLLAEAEELLQNAGWEDMLVLLYPLQE